jgi:hypothetical protein
VKRKDYPPENKQIPSHIVAPMKILPHSRGETITEVEADLTEAFL